MINILFFFMCLVAFSASHRFEGIQSTLKEDLKLERKLKVVNKPPAKSIDTKFGYIVDCIDINKQPAFEHPLLKNHKLQTKPSFQNTNRKPSAKISPFKSILGLEKNECPTGTVPIRRTTKNELTHTQSLLRSLSTEKTLTTHVAATTIRKGWHTYYGVSGTNSIYNPRVKNDQSTTSMMWVQNGFMDDTNKVVLGWHVFPELYNDDQSHVFAAWTKDNFKTTGCFNYRCLGFVQISRIITLGVSTNKSSIYGGTMIETSFSIFQDVITKNWWVSLENHPVGYFPASIFSNMTVADQVGWGGITSTSVGGPSPPMGSGYFPDGHFTHACYFRHVAFRDASGKDYGAEARMTDSFSDKPHCYGVHYYGDLKREFGFSLQFGGPGGKCSP